MVRRRPWLPLTSMSGQRPLPQLGDRGKFHLTNPTAAGWPLLMPDGWTKLVHPDQALLCRPVSVEECSWLDADMPTGADVWRFHGAQYGVVSSKGVAVHLSGREDFFELPRDALWWHESSVKYGTFPASWGEAPKVTAVTVEGLLGLGGRRGRVERC